MTHPAERRLAQAERDLVWARGQLPKALATLGGQTPTGWPSAVGGGGCSSPGATPTQAAALAGLTPRGAYLELDSLAIEVAGLLRLLVRALSVIPDLGVDTALEAAALRCSGGEGEWADPLCTRACVRKVDSELQRGQRLPVCWACLARGRRWKLAHGRRLKTGD